MQTVNLIVNLFILALLLYVVWSIGLLPDFCYSKEKEDSVKTVPQYKEGYHRNESKSSYEVWAANGWEVDTESGVITCTRKDYLNIGSLAADLSQVNRNLLGGVMKIEVSSTKLSFEGYKLSYAGKLFKDYISQRALNALEK